MAVFLEVLARAFSVGEIITHGPDLHFLMNNIDRWRTTVSSLCMVRSEWVREGWGRGARWDTLASVSVYGLGASLWVRGSHASRVVLHFYVYTTHSHPLLTAPFILSVCVMCVWRLHVWHVYAHVMDVLPGTHHSEEACRPLLVLNAIRLNNDVT